MPDLYFCRYSVSVCTSIANLGTRMHTQYDGFGEACVLTPLIIEFFEYISLLVRHRFEQVIAVPCHVFNELIHLGKLLRLSV